MIKQSYIRYKYYLNTLCEDALGNYRLNDMGVAAVTLSTILAITVSWIEFVYSMVYLFRDWRAGYITL